MAAAFTSERASIVFVLRRADERARARPPGAKAKYGSLHQELRKQLAPRVAAGVVTWWRCGELIAPGEPFDLGTSERYPLWLCGR